ncbi:MAG: hypothetical protein ACO1OO_06575 [Flavisolibacter sp.]
MVLRNRFREFVPIVLLFVILNGFFIAGRGMLERWGASQNVLIGGNLLIFALTFFSFVLAERGLQNKNPHAFVRAVYSSVLLKLFIGIIAAFVYIAIEKKNLNKPGLFTVMGLYLVYTFLEVRVLTRMLKKKNE